MLLKEGEIRIPAGCAISGFISRDGNRMNGGDIVKSISYMHDRSNGLGGGFAGYGIYPEYKDYYAFHVFYNSNEAREQTERFLDRHFDVINLSRIPTKKTPAITNEPLIWRYFVNPLPTKIASSQLDEKEFVAKCVIRINNDIDGAYVFSRTWAFSRLLDSPRTLESFTVLMNTRATHGPATAVIPQTPRAGGAALIPLRSLTIQ